MFLGATQADRLADLAKVAGYAQQAHDELLKRIASELDKRGTLDVLRRESRTAA